MAAYNDDEFEDQESDEITPDEAFLFRRCAILASHRLHSHPLYVALKAIADEYDAPEHCEGCSSPASTSDSEGTPLCAKCMEGLIASCSAQAEEDEDIKLAGWRNT